MKQLQKSDLKLGEIYWFVGSNIKFLNKHSLSTRGYGLNLKSKDDFRCDWFLDYSNIREATPEEKHWLETCIKADKFVSYEEAMKTFIPEYVECIILDSLIEVGKVYKTTGLKDWGAPYNDGCNKVYTLEIGNDNPYYTSQFKPSTKEAYDAQFVVKEPKVVLEEPKDKVLAHLIQSDITLIHSVECSEGGVYRIGDKITVFDKYSPNKGKPFTIKSFRWSKDKSKICAITELHTPNGIGLDKIELYVESKVKIVDDFVLPENWYIKVTDDNKEVLQQYIRNIHDSIMITLSNINYVAYSKWLKGINQTENKLGYGLISKLNLNPLPDVYRFVTYYNGVEITFEQFKKYVLKDE